MKLKRIFLITGVLGLSACNLDGGDDTASACDDNSVLVRSVDVSIDGLGFFAFESNGETLYSRRGDLCVDQTGLLIDRDGQYLLGFEPISDTVFNTGALARIALPITNAAGGTLTRVSINGAGIVSGLYSVGDAEIAAQLTLVTFPSPQGLEPVGAVMCRETSSSGGAVISEPGPDGADTIRSGLEGSYDCDQGRFDVEVVGTGFFRLNNAGTLHYDDAIVWGTDRDGYFVDGNGYRITGYAADQNGNIIPSLVDLHSASAAGTPQATTSVRLDANLNSAAGQPANAVFSRNDADSYNFDTTIDVYDSLGYEHALDLYFVQTAIADTWRLYAYVDDSLMRLGGAAFQTVTFAAGAVTSDPTLDYDPVILTNGSASLELTIDLSDLTQTNSAFALNSTTVDGHGYGVITAMHFAADGTVTLDLSNGQSNVTHAQVVLASFANAAGLTVSADGETLLSSGASGPPSVDVPGASGLGTIAATAH